MVYYIVSGLFLMFFWCPCMAINVNVHYNGGLLPDIIYCWPNVICIGEPVLMPWRGFVFAAFDLT